MSGVTVTVSDQAIVGGLNRLYEVRGRVVPTLMAIGKDVVERSKHRFDTLTAPDGTPWAPNARSTIERFIELKGGYGKKGINAKGRKIEANKRPLHGESGDLALEIAPQVTPDGALTIIASPIYAAMQQFGGKKSVYPHLWGDIPARPFLPITADGQLDPQERERILESLAEAIEQALHG